MTISAAFRYAKILELRDHGHLNHCFQRASLDLKIIFGFGVAVA